MGFVRATFGSWLTEVTVLGRKTAEKALLAPAGQGRGCHMTHPPTPRGVDLRPLPEVAVVARVLHCAAALFDLPHCPSGRASPSTAHT